MALASVRLCTSAPIAAMQCYRLATAIWKQFFEIMDYSKCKNVDNFLHKYLDNVKMWLIFVLSN